MKLGFSQCCPMDQTKYGKISESNKLAFYYYENQDQCDNGSDPLPHMVKNLDCKHQCKDGQFVSLDQTTDTLKCFNCPENTYSVNGLLIDGLMGDWDARYPLGNIPKEMENDCFYENDMLEFVQNQNCSRWILTGKSIKGFQADVNDTYVAFQLAYQVRFVTNGTVQFKYKKDTRSLSGYPNGVFRFGIGEHLIMEDEELAKSDWQEYQHANIPPGLHNLYWIYLKYQVDESKDQSAEIEYIKIAGQKYAPDECLPCKNGQSLEGAWRCSQCQSLEYLDDSNNSTNICKKCPAGTFSLPGSIGEKSCKISRPCTHNDMVIEYVDCLNQKQERRARWILPKYCDNTKIGSIQLPEVEQVDCKACTQGQFKNGDRCEFCQDGFFQPKNGTNSPITQCQKCGGGSFAPKVQLFQDFHNIPIELKKECLTYPQYDDRTLCMENFGWRPDSGNLSTGQGISEGVKLILTTGFKITDEHGGRITVEFRVKNLKANENFVIMRNKELIFKASHENEEKEYKEVFLLDQGYHKVELELNSETPVEENNEDSKVEVIVSKIEIEGTDNGGAIECKKCNDGSISEGGTVKCTKCEKGFEPNQDCVSYQILLQQWTLSYVFILHTSQLITYVAYIAPATIVIRKLWDQFYPLTKLNQLHKHHRDFNLTTIEYHQSADTIPYGYVFGIFDLQDASTQKISSILNTRQKNLNLNSECLHEIQQLKILKNIGHLVQEVKDISDKGYTVVYGQGDICDEFLDLRFSTEVEFVCNNETDGESWPKFISGDHCRYKFRWSSRFACPQCKNNQVKEIESSCNGKHQTKIRYANESCIMLPSKSKEELAKEDSKGLTFIDEDFYQELCSLNIELRRSKALRAILSLFLIFFLGGLICLCFIFKKYRKLKYEYSSLKENPGEVEMRTF